MRVPVISLTGSAGGSFTEAASIAWACLIAATGIVFLGGGGVFGGAVGSGTGAADGDTGATSGNTGATGGGGGATAGGGVPATGGGALASAAAGFGAAGAAAPAGPTTETHCSQNKSVSESLNVCLRKFKRNSTFYFTKFLIKQVFLTSSSSVKASIISV